MVDNPLLTVRLTERVCHVWSDAEIQSQLSDWQGCDAELAELAEELARYYELGGR
jgi:hypothetical protein